MVTVKPGYKTSELAVSVITGLAILLGTLTDNLSPHWAAISAAVSSGLYAISRGLSKVNPPKAVEPVDAPPAPPTTVAK